MSWNGTAVTVTGAGGFIGSHLVEELVSRGAQVRAFLRYNSRSDEGQLRFVDPAVRSQIEVMTGDLRDIGAVTAALDGQEVVFHLGALIAIPYSYRSPRETVETNVIGTLNVLEAARTCEPRRIVHISTSEVYGTAQTVPISEQHPLVGQSPYSASKIGADKIAEAYERSFGVPVVTVRPFNTYGPRQSARAVIPTIISQALTERSVRLGSLTPTRDFTFVTDTAAGMISAAEAPADRVVGRTVNLGVGSEISIADLVRRIAGIVGSDVDVLQDEQRLRPQGSEVERLLSDNSLMRGLTGWSPAVDLDEGLARTVDWVRDNLDQFSPRSYTV